MKLTGQQVRNGWSSVNFWRNHGVEAKWGKTKRGAPCIFVKRSAEESEWYIVDNSTLEGICSAVDNGEELAQAVRGTLALAHIFFLPI